jgi:hypothetical protein
VKSGLKTRSLFSLRERGVTVEVGSHKFDSRLDYKVMCAKCGRLLPYYELEQGFCARCRSGSAVSYSVSGTIKRRYVVKSGYRERLEFYGKNVFEDISNEINRINNSIKNVLCPYCGRNVIFDTTHFYVRNHSLSYIEGIYRCCNWRCRAKSRPITSKEHWLAINRRNKNILSKGNMQQGITFWEKFINKIWKLQ